MLKNINIKSLILIRKLNEDNVNGGPFAMMRIQRFINVEQMPSEIHNKYSV